MRLFLAVDPPAEAREHLQRALPPLEGLRLVEPELWHITLVFCGEVGASTATLLASELSAVASEAAPVELRLKGSGLFGSALWVGVEGELEGLADSCRRAAAGSGVKVEERAFHPHLTIARAPHAAAVRRQVRALSTYAGPGWTCHEIRLVRSRLGDPVRHETLHSWALGQ